MPNRKKILLSWLLVGTLDLSAATIQTLIYKRSVFTLMQYIASGVFGKDSFEMGWKSFFLGIAFHYVIALVWTLLFYFLFKRLAWMSYNFILTGVAYGLIVWTVMNRIVLPLSNVAMRPFALLNAVIAASILIVAIGIPLAYINRKK